MNIRDIVTLDDDNEYAIASKVNYEGKIYYYLIDINKNDNLMFCYEDNNELVELIDKELATKLLPLFLEASKDIINEFVQN